MSLELQYAASGRAGVQVRLGEPTLMVGSLMSNQIVLSESGVEPIHCLIEPIDAPFGEARQWRIVDLGTLAGVKVNGQRIDVETILASGDVVEIGMARLTLAEVENALAAGGAVSSGADAAPVVESTGAAAKRSGFSRLNGRQLFAPRPASHRGGRLLEVVAYWGDTVLNMDHFHPSFKGYDSVTIGDPTKAHFLSGGKEFFTSRILADVEDERCILRLVEGMKARVRKDGQMRKVTGDKKMSLGPRDYAHVEYGPIHYFLHFANPPKVDLPDLRRRDAFFTGLSLGAAVLYIILIATAILTTPTPVHVEQTIWDPVPPPHGPDQHVHVNEHHDYHITEVVMPPPPVHPVPPVHKQPVHMQPQPPQHQPVVKQALPPQPPHPQTQPQTQPPNPVEQHHTQPPVPVASPQPTPVASPTPKAGNPGAAAAHPATPTPTPSAAPGVSGAPAGDKHPTPKAGNTGGPGQKNAQSGALKGTQTFNNPGVEGGKQSQPSMPNLKTLGAGLGLVLNKPGGVHADFKTSAGGSGMKAGTATHDMGLGSPGSGQSLSLPGAAGALGSWGNGPGSMLGAGGPGKGGIGIGGPGGPGLGKPGGGGPGLAMGSVGGHKAANVVLAPQDPVTYSDYSADWILQVIRQHLNEIRHCYEQTLQRAPNTAGKMKVGFSIGPNGRVVSVSVIQTDIADTVMRACVTGHIQRWAFPKPHGTNPVQVTYPFIFAPVD